MFNFVPSSAELQTTQADLSSDLINFGIGQPGMDILPLTELREAAAHRLADDGTTYLNYGYAAGDEYCRYALAQFLHDTVTTHSHQDNLILTGGNSQALDLVCTMFAEPGDTVFIEEPTYFLALQIFADYHLNVVSIPMDNEGIRLDALEAALREHRPKFLYTIPAFHNPTAVTLSAERRQRILQLSEQHDFLIVADEVYQLLSYYEPPPAPFAAFIDSGRVLSLGTFSKILAPGLRSGWIETAPAHRQRLQAAGFVDSGGGVNHFTSGILRSAIELGLLHSYLEKIRAIYRQRLELMDRLIKDTFPAEIAYSKPKGGYFFWFTLPKGVQAADVKQRALLEKVSFHPGSAFSATGGLSRNFRLAFSFYQDEVIVEGVKRLGKVLHDML